MNRIVFLASPGASTNIIYNALAREFGSFPVILEKSLSRSQTIKRKLKKFGLIEVAGQVLFMLVIERGLRKSGAARVVAIKEEFGLDDSEIKGEVFPVESVNSDEARNLLKKLQPEIVIVNGTRIISTRTLECVEAKFVNIHTGITPTYRGVHGGYWALVEGHPELAGTTVHFIDKGIDTGGIIKQAVFTASAEDSFVTYPVLQAAVGVPLLIQTIRELMAGNLILQDSVSPLPSQLYSHPTLWKYLSNRISSGIR